ncbi:hypothetical protein [Frateuria defendens]|uniref:hypothetical protein n=1 Tax=Frateuria defendens TaxID=2219559 RepID=UPI0012932EF1|nr:hypothetical protein [Frateuria defendens]
MKNPIRTGLPIESSAEEVPLLEEPEPDEAAPSRHAFMVGSAAGAIDATGNRVCDLPITTERRS